MRKRWSLWRAAMWGAGAGVIAAVGAVNSPGNASASDAQLLGEITGSIIFPIMLFALVAAVRNWAVGARR
jgi:hypothetical protein